MTTQVYPATRRLTLVLEQAPWNLPTAAAGALASHLLSTVSAAMGATEGALQILAFKNAHATAWAHLVANNVTAFETDVSVSAGTYTAASLTFRVGLELEGFPTRPTWAAAIP